MRITWKPSGKEDSNWNEIDFIVIKVVKIGLIMACWVGFIGFLMFAALGIFEFLDKQQNSFTDIQIAAIALAIFFYLISFILIYFIKLRFESSKKFKKILFWVNFLLTPAVSLLILFWVICSKEVLTTTKNNIIFNHKIFYSKIIFEFF